ncbi:amidohydrolase family protein [Streptomyces sp. TLI_171]|uniref:amidohydrolase family protein n=1 Tax=Streptomyces sp. TLI_171 TaxID=1938859 RepID=UPI000C190B9F|nr:amidohydrolase family protein [Streptomyces sp. TLI_171]RKE19970.1 cytosine deaminase [Streptomyces sp. TLI_171]
MSARPTPGPHLLLDATLPDGTRADLRISDGRIAGLAPVPPGRERTAALAPGELALDGALLLPALVDGHAHLDKTFLGAPWQPHRATANLREQIASERTLRREVAARVPVVDRAEALARRMAALGTGFVRSHVDVDPDTGLDHLYAVLEARERVRELIEVQLVAFPQSGVVAEPGVPELLDAALREGAELVGGLDPFGFDGDVDGQLDVVFGLAERHGAGVDIHLHDGGPQGAAQLRAIAARTAALGLGGRVAVSHAYCLGQLEDRELDRTAQALARAGVAVLTNGPARSMPPVLRLHELGVLVFAGSDNIRDAWWPYGTADMLERTTIIGLQAELMTNQELQLAAGLATADAARALGVAEYGIAVGRPANLVAIAAHSVPEAVAAHPERLLVLHRGRTVLDRLNGPTAPAR